MARGPLQSRPRGCSRFPQLPGPSLVLRSRGKDAHPISSGQGADADTYPLGVSAARLLALASPSASLFGRSENTVPAHPWGHPSLLSSPALHFWPDHRLQPWGSASPLSVGSSVKHTTPHHDREAGHRPRDADGDRKEPPLANPSWVSLGVPSQGLDPRGAYLLIYSVRTDVMLPAVSPLLVSSPLALAEASGAVQTGASIGPG